MEGKANLLITFNLLITNFIHESLKKKDLLPATYPVDTSYLGGKGAYLLRYNC